MYSPHATAEVFCGPFWNTIRRREQPCRRRPLAAGMLMLACLALFFGALAFPAAGATAAASMATAVPAEKSPKLFLPQEGETISLTPVMSYILDPGREWGITHVAALGEEEYTPLERGIPGEYTGNIWLRFALYPQEAKGNIRNNSRGGKEYHLRLGTDLPGTISFFSPRPTHAPGVPAGFRQMQDPDGEFFFSLPDDGSGPFILFVRLEGRPGLWFAPGLSASGASAGAPFGLILPALLAAAALTGILRFGLDHAAWRAWGALLACIALLQHFFPPLPLADSVGIPLGAAALLAPGLMLMLLPHAGRQVLRLSRTAPKTTILFLGYAFLGALLALLPLVPQAAPVIPFLPLWPLLLAPLLPLAFQAFSRQTPGALAFLALVTMPFLGALGSLFELWYSPLPLLGSRGHLWGVALGTLALGLAGHTGAESEEAIEDDPFARYVDGPSEPDSQTEPAAVPSPDLPAVSPAASGVAADAGARADEGGSLEEKDTLRSLPAERRALQEALELPEASLGTGSDAVSGSRTSVGEHVGDQVKAGSPDLPGRRDAVPAAGPVVLEPLEEKASAPDSPIAAPEENFVAEQAAGISQAEPPLAVPEGQPAATGDSLEDSGAASAEMRDAAFAAAPSEESSPGEYSEREERVWTLFSLPRLVQTVYEDATARAEEKNLAVSWYIAPQLGSLFEGDAEELETALRLVLHDTVTSLDKGSITLSVRRSPQSVDPGHLLFAVETWSPPVSAYASSRGYTLETSGIAEAWRLSRRYHGEFSLEHSPQGNASLTFSVVFRAAGDAANLGEAEQAFGPRPTPMPGFVAMPLSGQMPEQEESRTAEQIASFPSFAEHPAEGVAAYPGEELTIISERDENRPILGGDIPPKPAAEPDLSDDLEEAEAWTAERIILADTSSRGRRSSLRKLAALKRDVLEARTGHEAVRLYARHPSGLLLFDADMPEREITAAIAAVRRLEEERGYPPAAVLTVTAHEMQARRMKTVGSSECLIKPVNSADLQEAVERLVPVSSSARGAGHSAQSDSSPEEVLGNALDHSPTVNRDNSPVIVPEPLSPLADDAAVGFESSENGSSFLGLRPDDLVPPAVLPADTSPAADAALGEEAGDTRLPLEGESSVKTPQSRSLPLLDLIITEDEAGDAAGIPGSSPAAAADDQGAEREKGQAALGNEGGPSDTPFPEGGGSVETMAAMPTLEAEAAPGSRKGNSGKLPLPGESDSISMEMLPRIPGMIHELNEALQDARSGREENNALRVQKAAERLADTAREFDLQVLERMARCVERAAAADDLEALADLFPELENLTNRYKEALRTCHRNASW